MSRDVTESRGRLWRRALAGAVVTGVCVPALAPSAIAAPAGRAYEMVSPPSKFNGGVVFGQRAAPDGETVGFVMNSASGGESAGHAIAPYVARRTAEGWRTDSAAPPIKAEHRGSSEVNAIVYDFSPDFSTAVVSTNDPLDPDDKEPLASGALTRGFDFYRFDLRERSAEWLSRPEPAEAAAYAAGGITDYAGQSQDGSHVLFQEDHKLLADAPAGGNVLYEAENGTVRYVGRLPDESAVEARPATGFLSAGTRARTQTISADGSRIYWNTAASNGPLYLREDGVRTIPVSASQRTGAVGTLASGVFAGASRDGSIVYFFSSGRLTDDATFAGLYRWERDGERLTYLVPRGTIQQPTYASDDGSRLYFASTQALLPEGRAGMRNLYLWEDGGLSLVAVTAPYIGGGHPIGALDPRLVISSDGRYAVFTSATALEPPHDSTGAIAVYRYDAETRTTVCVSCRPDGSVGAESRLKMYRSRYTTSAEPRVVQPTNILDDGRVYFESDEALDDADTNEASDVYEFDGEQANLITTGKGDGSELVDVSEDGSSVFFTTAESLSGWDTDGGYPDVYVARTGETFPEPLPVVPGCQGDACQGFPALPPAFGAPGTTLVEPDDTSDLEPSEVTFAPVRPTAKQLRGFAVNRRLVLRVRVSAPGSVLASAEGAVGKRPAGGGQGWTRATRRGVVRVTVPLNRAARRALAARKTLRVTVIIRHSHADEAKKLTLRLRSAARIKTRGGR